MKLNNFFLTSLVSALRLTSTGDNHILNCFSRVFFHYVVAVHVHFFTKYLSKSYHISCKTVESCFAKVIFFSKEGKYLLMNV